MASWNESPPTGLPTYHIAFSERMEKRIASGEVRREDAVRHTLDFIISDTNSEIEVATKLPDGSYEPLRSYDSTKEAEPFILNRDYIDGDAVRYMNPNIDISITVQALALAGGYCDAYEEMIKAGGNPNLLSKSGLSAFAKIAKQDPGTLLNNDSLMRTVIDAGYNFMEVVESQPTSRGDLHIRIGHLIASHSSPKLKDYVAKRHQMAQDIGLVGFDIGREPSECSAEEILACANIGKIHAVLRPDWWLGVPDKAIAMLDQMPLWVQEELEPVWQATRDSLEALNVPKEPTWADVQVTDSEHTPPEAQTKIRK